MAIYRHHPRHGARLPCQFRQEVFGLRGIGFNYNKYPINSYVLCKYYQGDINLENLVFENEIPGDIKKHLAPNQQMSNYSNLEFSVDKEYVTIDGVQYKKIN